MTIKTLSITGLRGFSETATLDFGLPNGKAGSGMTVLVGANNAGKSTVIEALNAIVRTSEQSFTEGKRNKVAGDRVSIELTDPEGHVSTLRTVSSGGSETERSLARDAVHKTVVVPSRRAFSPFFGRTLYSKYAVYHELSGPSNRSDHNISGFEGRIFEMLRNQESFSHVLGKVIKPAPSWTIDQADQGYYYIKFNYDGQYHTSDGVGDGIISLFFIVDALYDSNPGDTIVIDEPELSLHPQYLRRLAFLFSEYSVDRQIVLATHSAYFTDWNWFLSGGRLARVVRDKVGSRIYEMSEQTAERVRGLMNNMNNPHVLGLTSREVFFLQDQVILVEGQEDVVIYDMIAEQVGQELEGSFYGWGVGGATNMGTLASVLSDLGFRRVAGILDRNRSEVAESLRQQYPDYAFYVIPTMDVRTKDAVPAKPAVEGLTTSDGTLRSDYRQVVVDLFDDINKYLRK